MLQPFEVVAKLRNARIADSTKQTCQLALPLYEASCRKLGEPPWPSTLRTWEVFAANLKASKAYVNPVVYFWAIVEHRNRARGALPLDRSWVKGLVSGLERGLPVQEQAEPMTVPVMRQLGVLLTTATDLLLLLTLVGTLFSVARADSFISGPRTLWTLIQTTSGWSSPICRGRCGA